MSILRWKSITTSCLPPECVRDPRHYCFVAFEVPVTSLGLSDFIARRRVYSMSQYALVVY